MPDPGTDALPHARPRGDWMPYLVIAGLVAAFLWDSLLAGRAFIMRDTVFEFLPWREFAADAAREGRVPLWNPCSLFGQPFVANPQSGFFYPPHHLYDVLPLRWAFQVSLALHLFVAAAGMFALLRRFRLAREASVLGAIVFAFGAYFTANLEFMSVMDTLAWAPLTILLVCRAGDAWDAAPASRVRRTAPRAVVLALVVALQIVAGQAQVLVYTALAALVLGVALPLAEGRRRAAVATPVAFAAAGALAVGFALVQVVPTLELLPHSARRAGMDPGLDIASMAPHHLATLVLPLAFGRPGIGEWWGTTLFEFWLGCLHVGLAPLVCLTLAALPRRDGNRVPARLAAASAALGVLGIVIAMGKYTPVYEALQALPGVGTIRWPAKGLQLAAIGMAVLAAIGFDTLLARRESAAGRIDRGGVSVVAVWGAGAVALLLAATYLGRELFERLAGHPLPAAAGDAAFLMGDLHRSVLFMLLAAAALGAVATRAVPRRLASACVLAVSFANLLLVSRDVQFVGDASLLTPPLPEIAAPPGATPGHVRTRYAPAGFGVYGSRDPEAYRTAVTLLAGEIGIRCGVSHLYAGDALPLRDAMAVAKMPEHLPPDAAERLMDVLAVDREIRGPAFRDLLASQARVPSAVVRPGAVPRAFLVDDWEPVEDRGETLRRMMLGASHTAIEDPASGAPPLPPPAAAPGAPAPGRVVAVQPGRDKVDVEVQVDRPCVLVLCESWFPGWVARVDGDERPIRRVNLIFRGVPLTRGDRLVEFRYEPESFRIGALGSVAALAAGLALALWGRRSAA